MNNDNKMIELGEGESLAVSGGMCWLGELAAAADHILLGDTFSGSDPVKFAERFCNG